jgi:hypothetical protein
MRAAVPRRRRNDPQQRFPRCPLLLDFALQKHMEFYTVAAANAKGHLKQLTLRGGDKKGLYYLVPRFAQIGKGDQLRVADHQSGRLFVPSAENPDDLIPITPHFEHRLQISIGGKKLAGLITEIHQPHHSEALGYLEQFHYKTYDFSSSDEDGEKNGEAAVPTGGRRAVLIIYLKTSEEWQPAGYIELQMPRTPASAATLKARRRASLRSPAPMPCPWCLKSTASRPRTRTGTCGGMFLRTARGASLLSTDPTASA